MPLLKEIENTLRGLNAAIAEAEDNKKEIQKYGDEVDKASKSFSGDVKRVVAELADAQKGLENWEAGYAGWIDGLKDLVKICEAQKKKSSDAEKFYQQLLSEKEERDKAAKKAGTKTQSREDQIADAVLKKAKAAYDSDPSQQLAEALRGVQAQSNDFAAQWRDATDRCRKAIDQYYKMVASINTFQLSIDQKKMTHDAGSQVTTINKAFSNYYGVLS